MHDMEKIRRESLRWYILLTLNNSSPYPARESVIINVLRAEYPDCTQEEARKAMNYLVERKLIDIDKSPSGPWSAKITRWGVDVVEYTVDVDPGIARPIKYY